MKTIQTAVAALTLGTLAACAGPHTGGTFETSASYSRLYWAAMQAVPSVGYHVVSSNKADGLIVAEEGVIAGGGSSVGLNSQISDEGGKRLLHVDFSAPPGTLSLGGFDGNLNEYIASVKASVPDLAPHS